MMKILKIAQYVLFAVLITSLVLLCQRITDTQALLSHQVTLNSNVISAGEWEVSSDEALPEPEEAAEGEDIGRNAAAENPGDDSSADSAAFQPGEAPAGDSSDDASARVPDEASADVPVPDEAATPLPLSEQIPTADANAGSTHQNEADKGDLHDINTKTPDSETGDQGPWPFDWQ